MVSSSKPPSRYEVRSISLPSRSHPTTLAIEEELNRIKSWEASSSSSPSATSVTVGLSGLVELYRRVDDLLNLPLTQQALSQHQHEKWVNELVDGSMRFLDICESTRDTVSSIKEHLREVQSSLRRRKSGESGTEAEIKSYISFLRKTKKDTEKSLASLKKTESSAPISDLDQHVAAVVRVLQEASSVAGAVFMSLISFLLGAGPAKKRCSRWGAVARLVHKGAVACEAERDGSNELEAVEVALSNYKSGEGVHKKLEALDVAMEGIEDGLESLFRRLIQTRVSFLNILSQ